LYVVEFLPAYVAEFAQQIDRSVARQPTVFSMIGVNRAAAFNRDWQREDILNVRFEKLFVSQHDSSHSKH